jgi:hypothetical protein
MGVCSSNQKDISNLSKQPIQKPTIQQTNPPIKQTNPPIQQTNPPIKQTNPPIQQAVQQNNLVKTNSLRQTDETTTKIIDKPLDKIIKTALTTSVIIQTIDNDSCKHNNSYNHHADSSSHHNSSYSNHDSSSSYHNNNSHHDSSSSYHNNSYHHDSSGWGDSGHNSCHDSSGWGDSGNDSSGW